MRTFLVILIILSYSYTKAQPSNIKIKSAQIIKLSTNYNVSDIQLKSYYFLYLYYTEKNIILKKYKETITELPSYAEMAYKAGEINQQKKEHLILTYYQLEQNIIKNAYNISITENKIKQLLRSSSDIYPMDDSLIVYSSFEFIKILETHMSSDFMNDSVLINYIEMENHILEYQKYKDEISFYNSYLLPFAVNILYNLNAQLKSEEIDRIEYFTRIHEVYEIKINYITLVNELNQKAFEIENYYDKKYN